MKDETLRVVHLHSQNIRGGAEIACNQISASLEQIPGVYSRIFSMSPQTIRFEKVFSSWRYRFEQLLLGWGYSETLTPTQCSPRLDETKWDLVHLHSPYNSGLRIEEIARISRRIPTIWTIHDAHWILWREALKPSQGSESEFTKSISRATRAIGSRILNYRLSRLMRRIWVVFPSTWLSNQAATKGLSTGTRSVVIPSPVGSAFFDVRCSKHDAKVSFGFDPNRPIILFVAWKAWKSRGDMNKGYDILEQAIPILRLSHDFEFVILGHPGDALPKHLRARLLTPDGTQEQIARVMRGADFLVGPSRQESLGLVVQEAHATGTPALVSGSTGYIDVVDDGITGHHFEPGNPDDFARQASRMLENRNDLMEMGKRAREKAFDRWHPSQAAEQYSRLYLRAIRS